MHLEVLVKIALTWVFHVTISSINTPQNLKTVCLSRVMSSIVQEIL